MPPIVVAWRLRSCCLTSVLSSFSQSSSSPPTARDRSAFSVRGAQSAARSIGTTNLHSLYMLSLLKNVFSHRFRFFSGLPCYCCCSFVHGYNGCLLIVTNCPHTTTTTTTTAATEFAGGQVERSSSSQSSLGSRWLSASIVIKNRVASIAHTPSTLPVNCEPSTFCISTTPLGRGAPSAFCGKKPMAEPSTTPSDTASGELSADAMKHSAPSGGTTVASVNVSLTPSMSPRSYCVTLNSCGGATLALVSCRYARSSLQRTSHVAFTGRRSPLAAPLPRLMNRTTFN
jgi:hypothetical protein